jgi:hypothetical protein
VVVEEEVGVVVAFGLVATPMAKPPMAPARIPIKAKTSALSTKVVFPRLDICSLPVLL